MQTMLAYGEGTEADEFVDRISMTTLRLCSILSAWLCLQACAPLSATFRHELQAGRAFEGEVHGAFPELDLYVFAYRNRENFFDLVEVSLIAPDGELAATLTGLRRHDRVRIEGTLKDNRLKQVHVALNSLNVVSMSQYANNRAGLSHEPNRQRERRMRHFKFSRHAQFFLF